MRLQYEKQHATTVVATAALTARRFCAYDGTHASATAGGAKDVQGVTETSADPGQPVSLITGYSALVEAAEDIAINAYVKPAADGSGRAAVGSSTNHCGRALAAAAVGQVFELQILKHRHP